MNEYVARHDGTATTCEAFVDAMQAVTEIDLTQFRRWYSTAGTPTLAVTESYDSSASTYSLTVRQTSPLRADKTTQQALHIPLAIGLLDSDGKDLAIEGRVTEQGVILDITEQEQTFVFQDIQNPPVASVLRGFSAPVKLDHNVSDDTLSFLIANDSDAFNRWESGQRLAQRVIFKVLAGEGVSTAAIGLTQALASLLKDESLDAAFKAEALSLPTIDTLAEDIQDVNYTLLVRAVDTVMIHMADALYDQLRVLVQTSRRSDLPLLSTQAMGLRSLANTALGLLSYLPPARWEDMAIRQYQSASNMTDRLAAFACLCHTSGGARDVAINNFYELAKDNRLVLDKWFAAQATSRRESIVQDVESLISHADFDVTNPNRLRAVVASFAMNNPRGFHDPSGAGYQLVANQVIAVDKFNPQVASRMVIPLGRWRRLDSVSGDLMKTELDRISASGKLSADVYEVVSKGLK